jgi:hypothetical protein
MCYINGRNSCAQLGPEATTTIFESNAMLEYSQISFSWG